jgi:tetratricopeptide (TPR) repeat protein
VKTENFMADTSRIEQFRKMASDDPDNELGHFSLARAYLDAGMNAEAIGSLETVLRLNPNISKAYQLIGQALLKENRREEAIERLTQGVKVADDRGDVMPRTEMAKMLGELGVAAPEPPTQKQAAAVGEGEVLC